VTITDPFAAPAEEAQAAPVAQTSSPWDHAPTAETKTAAPVVVPTSDGKVVLTFKGGTGFDAPWIVVHATDLDDALRYVTDDATKVIDLMTRVQQAGKHFSGLAPASPSGKHRPTLERPAGSRTAPRRSACITRRRLGVQVWCVQENR